jgi:hypothetical protein
MPSPADELRAAAARARELAEDAVAESIRVAGADEWLDPHDLASALEGAYEASPAAAAHIAAWSPAPALAVAAWLGQTAGRHTPLHEGGDEEAAAGLPPICACCEGLIDWPCPDMAAALAVARTIPGGAA